MRPAVFLDRDDTLIQNAALPWDQVRAPRGDLCDPDWVRPLPGAKDACHAMAAAGFVLVVVTNQGLVARGVGTLDDVERTNRRMLDLLSEGGRCPIERVYVCPFHPKGVVAPFNTEHPWRKPAPGMILQAARELSLDLSRSWMVGDAERDVNAGVAAGLSPTRCLRVGPEQNLKGLADAARVILAS